MLIISIFFLHFNEGVVIVMAYDEPYHDSTYDEHETTQE